MAATNTTPIVMIAIDFDPFARGYVTSLAHPTATLPGIFFQQIELSAKRLEIAKELIPGLQTKGVFWDVGSAHPFQSLKNAGQKLGSRHALIFAAFLVACNTATAHRGPSAAFIAATAERKDRSGGIFNIELSLVGELE